MDSSSGGVQRGGEEVASRGGPVRHLVESETVCLFCAHVGSHGCGHRRLSSVVGRHGRLRFPSFLNSATGSQQIENQQVNELDSDRSLLVSEGVVPGFVRSSGGQRGRR